MVLSVEKCREILGVEANGKTDEQIEKLHDSIAVLADQLYDQVQKDWKTNPESVRWLSYAQDHPEEM